MDEIERLIKPAELTIPFNAEEPTWQEVNSILKKTKGKSAPGPNSIEHNVSKHCETVWKLCERLWKLLIWHGERTYLLMTGWLLP